MNQNEVITALMSQENIEPGFTSLGIQIFININYILIPYIIFILLIYTF